MKEIIIALKLFGVIALALVGVILNFPFNPMWTEYPNNVPWLAGMIVYDFIGLVIWLRFRNGKSVFPFLNGKDPNN